MVERVRDSQRSAGSRSRSRSSRRTGSYKPNRGVAAQLRQSHLNLNQKDMAKRYTEIRESREQSEK